MEIDYSKLTRLEIIEDVDIGEGGREYVAWEDGMSVTPMVQDDGRTLKIVIKKHRGLEAF